MAKTLIELARIDREAAVVQLMTVWEIGREQAERIIAVELGEFQGDVFTVDEAGNEIPLEMPPADWLRRSE